MRFVPKAARRRRRSPPCASSLAFRMSFSPSNGSKNPRRRSRSGPATPVTRCLAHWAREQGLAALLTGHHADDQAETLMMRLLRGAGVKGLAGMRSVAKAPGAQMALLRPLLGWRRSELEQLCADAGIDSGRRSEQRRRAVRAGADPPGARRGGLVRFPGASRSARTTSPQADAALHWATTPGMEARGDQWERANRVPADRCSARNPPPNRAPRDSEPRERRRQEISAGRRSTRSSPRLRAAARRRCAASSASAASNGGSPKRPRARAERSCRSKARIVIRADAPILGRSAFWPRKKSDERQGKEARQPLDEEPADLGRRAVRAGPVRADDRRRLAHRDRPGDRLFRIRPPGRRGQRPLGHHRRPATSGNSRHHRQARQRRGLPHRRAGRRQCLRPADPEGRRGPGQGRGAVEHLAVHALQFAAVPADPRHQLLRHAPDAEERRLGRDGLRQEPRAAC